MRRCLLLFLWLCLSTQLFGVNAVPSVVKRLQPDGSFVSLQMHGDERFHYCTTLGGLPVCQGEDGFYYVADLQADGIRPTQQRVGSWTGRGVLSPEWEEGATLQFLRQQAVSRWDATFENASRFSAPSRRQLADLQQVHVLVLPVYFQDVSFSMEDPQVYFDNLLNASRGLDQHPSAKNYFLDNLGDDLDLQFEVLHPIQLPRSRAYYGKNDAVGQDANPSTMVDEACRMAARSGVDFSQYDLDGDGVLDYLFVYYAGHNEAEGGPEDSVWPHAHTLADRGLVLNGVRIGPYACTSELRGGYGLEYAGIGTFCHEFAHLLGLVDLYDTDGSIGGSYSSLWGPMALMYHGAYNNKGLTPPNLCAVDLDILGMVDYITLSEGETVTLPELTAERRIVKLETNQPGEYYLFEVRHNIGWDAYIGGNGMLVYHIDRSDQVADGIRASKRWEINRVNGSASHPCADLVEAKDWVTDLRQFFFPGGGQVFSLTTQSRPALVSWSGEGCGLGIDSIRLSLGYDYVTFRVIRDMGYALPRVTRHTVTVYQQELELEWFTDMSAEVDWVVEWRTVADSYFQNVTVSQNHHRISGLKSDETYLIRLTPRTQKYLGDTYEFDARTARVTAPFPAIGGMDRPYVVGDVLNLQVINLAEPVSRIRWLVNDHLMSEPRMQLTEPGSYRIRAELTYESDGAKEYLYKTLNVRPKEGAFRE